MRAAIDISFLRALSIPCTWATSVLSVNRTTSFGESEVFRIIVSPFLAWIRPSTFTDCATTVVLNNASPMIDRVATYAILDNLYSVIAFSVLKRDSREHQTWRYLRLRLTPCRL